MVFSLLQFQIDYYEYNENVHVVTDLKNKKHVLNKKTRYNHFVTANIKEKRMLFSVYKGHQGIKEQNASKRLLILVVGDWILMC